MKKMKLALFNVIFAIVAILCFSKRGLGLSFDPSNGAFLFAGTIALSFFGVAIFIFGNYVILNQRESSNPKIGKLTTVEDCMSALYQCKKTDPSFIGEIEQAIEQLKSLQRRRDSLKMLLDLNDVSESFDYLNNTANVADKYVISNIKSIINRLIAFDNEEYLQSKDSADISSHKAYIRGILEENKTVLKEYSSMIEAVSKIGDQNINLSNIKSMTAALNKVIKGKNFDSLDENKETQ